MAISTYSLLATTEVYAITGEPGTNATTKLNALAADVTAAIEDYCDRRFVTRGALTEFHTVADYGESELWLLDWPIINVSSAAYGVWEDSTRNYAAAEKLTLDTDYLAVKPKGKLVRVVADGGKEAWECGLRAVKVIYTAGYASTAAIPDGLKRIARELAGLMWRDRKKDRWGVLSWSDAPGSVTRFAPAILTDQLQRALMAGGWKRVEFSRTGERDA